MATAHWPPSDGRVAIGLMLEPAPIGQQGVDPLARVAAKLDRATDHLQELRRAIATFLDSDPCAVVQTLDARAGLHVGRFRVWRQPPPALGVVAGEAIGQCRGALDHLMAAMVQLHRGPRRTPNFPIIRDESKWVGSEGKSQRDKLRQLLRPEHFERVEGVQPFLLLNAGPRIHFLSRMQALNNVDKHELVSASYIAGSALWRTRPDNANVARVTGLVPGGLADLCDGAQLYAVSFVDETDAFVAFQLVVSLRFTLPDGDAISVDTVDGIIGATRRFVEDIRSVTPEFQQGQ